MCIGLWWYDYCIWDNKTYRRDKVVGSLWNTLCDSFIKVAGITMAKLHNWKKLYSHRYFLYALRSVKRVVRTANQTLPFWCLGWNILRKPCQNHGPLTRYVKLQVAHAPGMPGTISPPPTSLVSDTVMHHGTCVKHTPWCMSGPLTCSGTENVPDIPGACANYNFAYLVRGPLLLIIADHLT